MHGASRDNNFTEFKKNTFFFVFFLLDKISMVEQGVVEIISNLADSYQEVRKNI